MLEHNNYQKAVSVMKQVQKAVIGKEECIVKIMSAILAGGHILMEDIPGVGKTTMALAFSRAMELKQNRLQFTPDVLPTDILGFSIYKKEQDIFEYQPGAIMCNLFLADEINRTSPKTQSALLEVMEEKSVTIEGIKKDVPKPFIVIATQNPVGSAGTQMLPESQVDRFMICVNMGYPSMEDEIRILKGKSMGNPLDQVEKVIEAWELREIQNEVEQIYMHDEIYSYLTRLVQATRNHEMIELGMSPRGTIALMNMAKSWAYLCGRNYVQPEDVTKIFPDVAGHRIKLATKARIQHVTVSQVIAQVLQSVSRPSVRRQ